MRTTATISRKLPAIAISINHVYLADASNIKLPLKNCATLSPEHAVTQKKIKNEFFQIAIDKFESGRCGNYELSFHQRMFESGCGWVSFTPAHQPRMLLNYKEDKSYNMTHGSAEPS